MHREPVTTARPVVVLAATCALLAASAFVGGVVADNHTRGDAPHYGPDEKGNATFEFLEQGDHYPGARNVDVRYTMKGGDVFEEVGATDGVAADRFVVATDAVDHSDCSADNVATFAIDRGDDGTAGENDQDLLQHTKQAYYFNDSVVVEFYDYRDFGGDPPVVNAEDRIVLELSDDAADGACADTTEKKGWYTAETFLNGTGPRGANRTDERYGFTIESEWNYVCRCDSEEEAREQLGPDLAPATATETPRETEASTPTPTSTPTETPPSARDTPSDTPADTPIVTASVNESAGDVNVSANGSVGGDGGSVDGSAGASGGEGDRAADPPVPTPADGPGFGAGVAVATLLGYSMLARRRLA